MDIQSLTPPAGRLKCLWVRAADGRLESIWVPDWEADMAAESAPAADGQLRKAS